MIKRVPTAGDVGYVDYVAPGDFVFVLVRGSAVEHVRALERFERVPKFLARAAFIVGALASVALMVGVLCTLLALGLMLAGNRGMDTFLGGTGMSVWLWTAGGLAALALLSYASSVGLYFRTARNERRLATQDDPLVSTPLPPLKRSRKRTDSQAAAGAYATALADFTPQMRERVYADPATQDQTFHTPSHAMVLASLDTRLDPQPEAENPVPR